MMFRYLNLFLACVACVSTGSWAVEHSCHPLTTVSSTTTVVETPAASTTTVKKTETFYTRVTRYRAGHTLEVLVNVASTSLYTCTPASPSHASLRKRVTDSNGLEPLIPSIEQTPAVTKVLYLNSSTISTTSVGNTEEASLSPETYAQLTELSQPCSTQGITPSPISLSAHWTTQDDLAQNIATIAAPPISTTVASQLRPKIRFKPVKPTQTQHQIKSNHGDSDHTRGRKTPHRPINQHNGLGPTKTVTESFSPSQDLHAASTRDPRKGYKTVERDIIVEVELVTTRSPSETGSAAPTRSSRTKKHKKSPRPCNPTLTLEHVVTSTARRPTVTRTVTFAKLKTSTVRATKTASTKRVTRTSVVATTSATVIAGRSGRYTGALGGGATFDVYKNVSFPEGDLARCACDGKTSCAAAAGEQTCASLETCIDLCAGWNRDPKGPVCVGVSFVRSEARVKGSEASWCHLKWIVPPHSIPPQSATCGWVSLNVDSAVLRRQKF